MFAKDKVNLRDLSHVLCSPFKEENYDVYQRGQSYRFSHNVCKQICKLL